MGASTKTRSKDSAELKSAADFDVTAMTQPGREVEAYIDAFLEHRPLPGNLREGIRYGVFGGGKRLRPVLVVRTCEAVGGSLEDAMPPAAAIELVHCFSLVHDDLPAMDDDDMRRGRPTLHKHANEAMAILAGDGMLSLAFELIVTRVSDSQLASQLVRELSVATSDMVAGQVYDTLPDFKDDVEPLDRLEVIHKHKTAALLRASCRMGAIIGGGTAQQLAAVTRYADAIGLMFQIVDDLLDVTATEEELGKATGKDADKGKFTSPGVIGMDASRKEVHRLQYEARAALEDFNQSADALRQLCDFMAVRRK